MIKMFLPLAAVALCAACVTTDPVERRKGDAVQYRPEKSVYDTVGPWRIERQKDKDGVVRCVALAVAPENGSGLSLIPRPDGGMVVGIFHKAFDLDPKARLQGALVLDGQDAYRLTGSPLNFSTIGFPFGLDAERALTRMAEARRVAFRLDEREIGPMPNARLRDDAAAARRCATED